MMSVPWTLQGRISVMMFCDHSKNTVTEPGPTMAFQILHFFFQEVWKHYQVRKFPLFSGNLEMKVKQDPWIKVSSFKAEQVVDS